MSEAPAVPEPSTCDGCGQTDTAPMIHIAYGQWKKDARTTISEPSFHFDCLPDQFRAELDGPEHAVTVAAIAAAESGTKGDALREFIAAQPDDNNLEPAPEPAPEPDAALGEAPAFQTEGI